MPLFHRSQSSARLPNGSSCHLNALVYHNDESKSISTANEMSTSPSSSSLLPMRNGKHNSSRQALHTSNSVISFGSVGSRGGRTTPNTPSKRPPHANSKIRHLRKKYPKVFSYIPEAPTQKQKLILATLILLYIHRGDVAQFLAHLIGKLIRNLITVRVMKHQLLQSSPEADALWKASIRLPNPQEYQHDTQTPQRLRQSPSPPATSSKPDDDPSPTLSDFTIDLVISHCNLPVDWIFTSFASPEEDAYNDDIGYDPLSIFRNVTIISKCNLPVEGAPPSATIIRLPNVGRCDHSYAHYLANYYFHDENHGHNEVRRSHSDHPSSLEVTAAPQESNTDASSSERNTFHATLFLKDNDNHHRAVYSRQRSLLEMLQITQKRGFACHEERIWTVSKPSDERPLQKQQQQSQRQSSFWKDVAMHPICQLSSYHNWTQLQHKQMSSYIRLRRDKIDLGQFRSTHGSTIGEYAKEMGMEIKGPIVPVCYGGNFMASADQLFRYSPSSPSSSSLFHKMEASLSRASNIAEGHFVERLWAALLSLPLTTSEVEQLKAMASAKQPICNAGTDFQGALTKY
ncbi:unnamed protein product [Cylindrotheca closterium]|uniref:Uncharacterized protein n=1 Tax=Cylindrotheca closterium TaxID=2856 RepID=A0AAD2GDG1_9STRA|nr:unnamed protein product [Cylindrotheca closterium]